MNYQKLAEIIFKSNTLTIDEILRMYPKRQLSEGAKVTRMAPSPTGFMHLGNLFGALADERIAHQSGGILYLRIEDTDKKREVASGVATIIESFKNFNILFDEGATIDGHVGDYGPYRQSLRRDIYSAFAKQLMINGLAYPCFCSEEDLAEMRQNQEMLKENFGYYGKYAKYRDCPMDDIEQNLQSSIPYVVRFRSNGNIENKVIHNDLIRGKIELSQNNQDFVILKSDGMPTYHFAHVIDDFLMGTTHVIRGEEWLATLPIHLELYNALELRPPKYLHTAHLMKSENGSKRKLSKRKDPELALSYYHEQGFCKEALIEYLMTLLNSNYEEWRIANPNALYSDFKFSINKMASSGALFDMDKLMDISKTVISKFTAEKLYCEAAEWLYNYDNEFYKIFTENKEFSIKILDIGRGVPKPRKDIGTLKDIKPYMSIFFEQLYVPADIQNIPQEDINNILGDYIHVYNENDSAEEFFERLKPICAKYGYAPETKLYKKEPDIYKGSIGDISMLVRLAITGKTTSPDLYEVMQILGKQVCIQRLKQAISY